MPKLIKKRCAITLLIGAAMIFANIFYFYSAIRAGSGPRFQIGGYYLGATPDAINVSVEVDPEQEEKYYEVETNGIMLFFVKVDGVLRLYRVVEEQVIRSEKIRSVLNNLKAKYGPPDKQQIKTSSLRPKNRASYTTTVKNKAIWKISETQEFVAEIESSRVVYELLEHNPENIKTPNMQEETTEPVGATNEKWNPDY